MDTAIVSEHPTIGRARERTKPIEPTLGQRPRGSSRFWHLVPSAVVSVVLIGNQFLPPLAYQQSLPDRTQQLPPITNTSKIPPSASVRTDQEYIEQNFIKTRIIVETATTNSVGNPTPKPPEASGSYLVNLVNSIVDDRRLGILEKDKEFWKKRMLQLISIESSGDYQAFSGKAYGLTQLRPATAEGIAKKYGIAEYDLNNPWDNAFLGLANQLDLAKRYGPELGAWTHHLGSGNMDTALRTYLIEDLKLKVKDVDDDIFKSNETLLKAINKYQITPSKLLNSPPVTGKLKGIGAFGDNTDIYYSKLMAVTLPQTKG